MTVDSLVEVAAAGFASVGDAMASGASPCMNSDEEVVRSSGFAAAVEAAVDAVVDSSNGSLA